MAGMLNKYARSKRNVDQIFNIPLFQSSEVRFRHVLGRAGQRQQRQLQGRRRQEVVDLGFVGFKVPDEHGEHGRGSHTEKEGGSGCQVEDIGKIQK